MDGTVDRDAVPMNSTPPVAPPRRNKPKPTEKKPEGDSPPPSPPSTPSPPEPAHSPITTKNVFNISHSNKVHIGPKIEYNFAGKANVKNSFKQEPKTNVIKTESIERLMKSTAEISCNDHSSDLILISRKLGEEWRNLFRKLGYEDSEIETLYETHFSKGISEVIYQILLDWIRSDTRTLGKLCTLLWDEGWQSLVQELAAKNEDCDKN